MNSRNRAFTLAFLVMSNILAVNAQGTVAGGRIEYFVSDANGVPYESIAAYRGDEFKYVLELRRDGDRDTRRLLSSGKEIMRWEILNEAGTLKRQKIYNQDALAEESEYEAGRLVSLRVFSESGSSILRKYSYANDRIVMINISDGKGMPVRTDFISYDRTGLAYQVRRVLADGTVEMDGNASWVEDSLEWRSSPSAQYVKRRDASGNVVFEELFDKDKTIERIRTEYAYGRMRQRTVDYPDELKKTVSRFDPEERIIEETRWLSDFLVSSVSYSYDKNGKLVSIRSIAGNSVELTEYRYDDGKSLSEERFSRDGTLEKIITHEDGEVRIESIYDNGALFARVYYKGEKKIREELIVDGAVIRERISE